MSNQPTPEIDRLRKQAWSRTVYLSDAERAVRDAEARVRAERFGVDLSAESIARHARREMAREIVEALRERDTMIRSRKWAYDGRYEIVADFIERTFLNGEGSDGTLTCVYCGSARPMDQDVRCQNCKRSHRA